MFATIMQAIKARRELRVLSLIHSGGLEPLKMLTEQSRTVAMSATLQLVHLDFTSFEMTTDLNESPKVKHILVIVDFL